MTLSLGLFLISMLMLSCLSYITFNQQNQTLAQQYIQTIKFRNFDIDLGNGVKTSAQLTFPAIGKGPFPGVLLVPGSGAVDKNETLAKNVKPFWQIAQYLSERGFAVLRYDKRGIGESFNILNSNVWGNVTINDLIQDSKRALSVLIQQPEVDAKRISIIGHSEGTVIAPRVAIDNPTKVKNIVLMGTVAQNLIDIIYNQYVNVPSEYAKQILDKNHTGLISIQQISKNPYRYQLLVNLLVPSYDLHTFLLTNNTKIISDALVNKFRNNTIQDGYISIDKQLKPLLIKSYENLTSFVPSKCNDIAGCPLLLRSYFDSIPTLSIIGNISKSTDILLLNGENDSQTPVQQAFLLQQRLTDVNHPDHTLITYPNLGHVFYPSSEWLTAAGPIQPYVLADIYAWLEFHSGLSHSFEPATATNNQLSSNMTLSTNSSNSSSSINK